VFAEVWQYKYNSFTEKPAAYVIRLDVHKKHDKQVEAIRKLLFSEANDTLGHRKKKAWAARNYLP
jgi:hypothetical protein